MSVPSPPNIKGQPLASENTLEFAWNPPSQTNGTIQAYRLILNDGSSDVYTNSTINPSARYARVGPPEISLVNGTTYYASLEAQNENGWSARAFFRPFQPGSKPTVGPSTATAAIAGASSILVSWTPPISIPDATIFWYVLQSQSTNPSDPIKRITANGLTQTNYLVNDLNSQSSYNFLLRAVNCPGWSPSVSTNTVAFTQLLSASNIGGLSFWLDASQLSNVTNGQGLSTWNDLSTNGFSGTAVGSPTYLTNQINGLPIVRFNGSSQYVTFGNVLNMGTSPLNMFAMYKFNSTAAGNAVFGKTRAAAAASRYALVRDTSLDYFIVNTESPVANLSYPNTSTAIQLGEGLWDRTTAYIYRNGTLCNSQALSSSANLSSTDPLVVGAYPNSSGTLSPPAIWMNGDIAELLIYTSTLSTYQRQQVEGYLSWKWGQQSNLPLLHPFRNAAPRNVDTFYPTQINGIAMWLDGTDPLGTGNTLASQTTVNTWIDKSGLNNDAVAGTSAQYIQSAQGGYLDFLGSNYYTITNNTILTGKYYSIFIVERLQSIGTTRALMGGDSTTTNANISFAYSNNQVTFGQHNNNLPTANVASFTTPENQEMRIWSISQVTNAAQLFLNGRSISANLNNTLPSAWTNARIGSHFGSNFYYGQYSEFIIYNSTLTTNLRQTIEGYLAWKYNLQSNLPVYHPYYNTMPVNSNFGFSPNPIPILDTNFNNGNNELLNNFSTGYLSVNTPTGSGFSYNADAGSPIFLYKSTALPSINTITYCASIYRTGTRGYAGIFHSSRSGAKSGFIMTSDGVNLTYNWNDDNGTYQYSSGYSPPFNTWTHVALVISPSQAKFYVNGVLTVTRNYSHAAINVFDYYIAADPGYTNRMFPGLVDNIAIFPSTLTDAQISTIYSSTLIS